MRQENGEWVDDGAALGYEWKWLGSVSTVPGRFRLYSLLKCAEESLLRQPRQVTRSRRGRGPHLRVVRATGRPRRPPSANPRAPPPGTPAAPSASYPAGSCTACT